MSAARGRAEGDLGSLQQKWLEGEQTLTKLSVQLEGKHGELERVRADAAENAARLENTVGFSQLGEGVVSLVLMCTGNDSKPAVGKLFWVFFDLDVAGSYVVAGGTACLEFSPKAIFTQSPAGEKARG